LAHFAQIFAFGFVTGLSGALIPGPLLAFNIQSAAKRGPATGFLVVVGHGLLEATLVIAIFAGARRYLQNQIALRVIAGIGALFLATMGVMMIRKAPKISLSEIIESGQSPSKVENRVLGGFLLSLLNPSFPLWWMAVGLSLTARVTPTAGNVSAFYAGHISSDFAWYVFVSLVVGLGRRHIPDKAYRTVLVVLALLLIVYACMFGWAAATGVRPPGEAGAGDPVGGAQVRLLTGMPDGRRIQCVCTRSLFGRASSPWKV
jgi:threonine/homoserine/homoserine lactone efflux protein